MFQHENAPTEEEESNTKTGTRTCRTLQRKGVTEKNRFRPAMVNYSTMTVSCSRFWVFTPTTLWIVHLSLGILPCWLDSWSAWLRYPSSTTMNGQDSYTHIPSCFLLHLWCTRIPWCVLSGFSYLDLTQTPGDISSWLVSLGNLSYRLGIFMSSDSMWLPG